MVMATRYSEFAHSGKIRNEIILRDTVVVQIVLILSVGNAESKRYPQP